MSAGKHTPGPGEHGYRVTPPRFCAGCGEDVSAGCPCCAPSRELGRHWCRRCYFGVGSKCDAYRQGLIAAAPDLLEALERVNAALVQALMLLPTPEEVRDEAALNEGRCSSEGVVATRLRDVLPWVVSALKKARGE